MVGSMSTSAQLFAVFLNLHHYHRLFVRALTEHKSKFPPKFKPQTGRPPAWQKAVTQAVFDMDTYTQDDLADDPTAEEEPGKQPEFLPEDEQNKLHD